MPSFLKKPSSVDHKSNPGESAGQDMGEGRGVGGGGSLGYLHHVVRLERNTCVSEKALLSRDVYHIQMIPFLFPVHGAAVLHSSTVLYPERPALREIQRT